MDRIKTIFFDYDGTLHDSLQIYSKAFIKAYDYLEKNGYAPVKNWTYEEIKLFLGLNPKEMWEQFTPKLSQEVIHTASGIISQSMEHDILTNQAVLYEGAIETLEYLKSKNYYLVYLSNSKEYYMEAHRKAFKLDKYFDLMICSEMYDFIPKKLILEKVKDSLLQSMVIIGDRIHDMESGFHNKIHTIACDYGYGSSAELINAELHIKDIRDLKNIL